MDSSELNELIEKWKTETNLTVDVSDGVGTKSRATPIRNVRIPDALWASLSALAKERNTSITKLLIEGVHLLLDGEENDPTDR